ncbi:two-component system, OmpR family, alkaline phosphatase synthesis response regulator PhoP/two-component system, OmpR family, response regulator VicR [Mucilaginibacter mallensis]|uniref:Two-component system, OmpR family, alkaline phosphatase synthesis response regulator PhoP/two-component system, OmpR family, response regulator VicR n=1 Tax=Mucilaginibacter mallensis TaxID=652787 RepID=A0A1H1QYE9_MUCMA|nr:response regulator [Mucilaginibacter mallensis]SDS28508.1 two-component system, OmpR family, alkaline phosphatase synthesis response regulator PhoP/two-component system, OmpR family, response regulator VicR [Mucilaginibacter mallensis]
MRKRILVLDDNQDILDIIHEALLYQQFEVKVTLDSTTIINITQEYQPDLIILDYHLTGKNGQEICQLLKTHPDVGHIPVIICSAYVQKDTDLSAWGCDDVIAKPFGLEELTEKVNNLILG